jgi:F-type H+-transporting ATPase subunit gamma
MPSIKDLKKRIGTVKNTQQTTRAMKMVSAAKLRRAQEAIQNQRPYAKRISELIEKLLAGLGTAGNHVLLRQEKPGESAEVKRVLLVIVTSDRGLCGGFNSSVIKAAQKWISSNQNSSTSVELAFVGRKGYEFFKGRKVYKLGANYSEFGGKVTFAKSKQLADTLVGRFLNHEVDEIKIIYNEFKNAVTQKVMVEDFLPLSPATGTKQEGSEQQAEGLLDYIVKPDPQTVLKELLDKNFAIQTFRILLESQAGEHGARMSAMENATKNAGEMIRKLTLQFNKQRQAGITKELLEIISGSESQKG